MKSYLIVIFFIFNCYKLNNYLYSNKIIIKINNNNIADNISSNTIKIGYVSWYGNEFHNNKTANGEIFNENDYTAASPILKFNTKIKIMNIANNNSVIVRINDRGPFKCYKEGNKILPFYPLKPHDKRVFDLSKSAFKKLSDNKKGILKIKYHILN